MERIAGQLRAGGALVIGAHEALPDGLPGFAPWPGAAAIHLRLGEAGSRQALGLDPQSCG
jgi:hypothetical protein